MELLLLFILFFSFLISINSNYIIIPFDSMVYNPENNNKIASDFLSSTLSEDIYFNLSIGTPKQTIKTFIRLDQYELRINEPRYISSLSKSFKADEISDIFICTDNFYFMSMNSTDELNNFIHSDKANKEEKEKELIKEYNDISFVFLNDTKRNKFLEHELLEDELNRLIKYNYSMLGLRHRKLNFPIYPQFVGNLKQIKQIDKSIFTFIFNENKNEGHLGYLIIGDLYYDKQTEYEEVNKTNFALRRGGNSWDLHITTIFSESKKENLISFYERSTNVELRVELAYFLGTKYYKEFIEKEFFNDLVNQKICEYKHVLIDESYGTYVCDGKSKIFSDYYNNKFPNLVFILHNIDDKLIFTKDDLFFTNPYNKSDTNYYFKVYFHIILSTSWSLGRDFLKKYRLSFSYDSSIILYHKNKIINNIKDNIINESNNNNKSKILKIFFIILLCLAIFILGFLFHKAMIKKPRKAKANELDDEFDYQNDDKNKKLNKDFDINTDNNNKKGNSLYLELGTKNN